MFTGALRAFHETVRAGSIRKASETLGVAPSSVSRQIAILEQQIGTALFHRRAGGLQLTHAGTLVAGFARSVLVEYDTLRTDLDDIRGTQRRLVKLAMVESIASCGPVRAVARVLARYPTVSFDLQLMPAPKVFEAVRNDETDLGLTFCAPPDPDILTVASLPEPIILAVRADHILAVAGEVELADLKSVPLALPDSNFAVRQIFDRASAAAGFRVNPVLSSNVFDTLRDFVRYGAGVAVLPRRAVGRDEGRLGLRAIPIAGEEFRESHIDLIVLRRRRLPRIVRTLADALAEEISTYA
jgi:DNA-binding transcriptional LysR family regulator